MDGIQNDIYSRAEEILEEIRNLKQDVKEQFNNDAEPEIIAATLQEIISLTVDLESLRAIMFVADALEMEDLEKEFFFENRLPRVMKTLERHHN